MVRRNLGLPHRLISKNFNCVIWVEPKYSKLAINKTDIMAKRDSKETIEELQMKEKIKHLEQALVNSELRATALEMMIEVAEKELKINIRKKSNTKPSSK